MIYSRTDIAKDLFASLEEGDAKRADRHLSPDFACTGPFPMTVNKAQFIEINGALKSAMPDYSFNAINFEEEDDTVKLELQITGTNTKGLNLPFLGVSAPATDKEVSLPREPALLSFRGDKIVSLQVEQALGGGIEGLLNQLGIELHAPAV